MLRTTRDAVSHYDELLLEKHLASTQDHLARATERHQLYVHGRPHCELLRPHMIDAPTYERVQRATTLVNRAIVGLVERLLVDPALAKAAGVPPYFEQILCVDRSCGGPCTIARLDGFLDSSGSIKFIEYNTDPWAACICESDEIDVAFSAMPIAREFAARFPFRTVHGMELALEALYVDHERHGGRGAPTFAAVGATHRPPLPRELSFAAWRGCRVVSAALEELAPRGTELFVEDQRVDVVFIDWAELLELIYSGAETGKALLSAIAGGSVRTLTGLSRGLLSGAKILFDLLSDPAHSHLFDRDVAVALAEHIPWTRRVRECRTTFGKETIDLMPFVADHADLFVIKPSGGQAGEGVVLGWECDDTQWRQAVKRALSRPYVVQQRVSGQTEPVPAVIDGALAMVDRLLDFNPYVWNGERVDGALVRGAGRGLLNLFVGGSLPAKWILDA